MRVLVIGGNGFIGSHLVDRLVIDGHEVTVFDRFSASVRFAEKPVARIVGDFLNTGDLRDAMTGQDIVYHLISLSTPVSAASDPLLDMRINVVGSVELLRIAVESGVNRVYYASTGGAIYGDSPSEFVDETMRTEPFSPYGIGKLAVENYLEYFRRTAGLESVSLRLSNPYGPRQNPNQRQGVIPIFLRHIHRGEPVTVYGDGSMVRDFIYVEDLARMMAAPLAASATHNVFNIGSGVTHSVADILGVIQAVTGARPEVLHPPVPPTFVDRIALSIERYRTTFGDPGPLIGLEDGVRRTWADIQAEGR